MSGHPASHLPAFRTIPETADHLKVSPKTVRRWIKDGYLKVHRFGRQLRVAEPDLVAFIDEHRQ